MLEVHSFLFVKQAHSDNKYIRQKHTVHYTPRSMNGMREPSHKSLDHSEILKLTFTKTYLVLNNYVLMVCTIAERLYNTVCGMYEYKGSSKVSFLQVCHGALCCLTMNSTAGLAPPGSHMSAKKEKKKIGKA